MSKTQESQEVKSIRAKIRETRKEMKEQGIKRTSCFNGGLSRIEWQYNARMFELETNLNEELKKS